MKGTQILRTTEEEDRTNQWMNKYRPASGGGVARGHRVNAGWELLIKVNHPSETLASGRRQYGALSVMWGFCCVPPPRPRPLFHVWGWQEVYSAGVPGCPRWTAQRAEARQREAGAAVITGSHTRGEGSLMTGPLCFQGRGHANASRVIYSTRHPASTQP